MVLNINKAIDKKIKNFLISSMKLNTLHELPSIDSVIINTNLGSELNKSEKLLSNSKNILEGITLQSVKVVKAKKSVSNFKLKKDDEIALICTLRKTKLNLFITKLIFFTFPQIEIWKISNKVSKFDGQYNFSFGINEHLVFPEIGFSFDKKPFGLNVNLKFKQQNKDPIANLLLLKLLKII